MNQRSALVQLNTTAGDWGALGKSDRYCQKSVPPNQGQGDAINLYLSKEAFGFVTQLGFNRLGCGKGSSQNHKSSSEKFFDTEFCPPSPPTLGGKRVNFILKVPSGALSNGRVNRPWVAPQNWGI